MLMERPIAPEKSRALDDIRRIGVRRYSNIATIRRAKKDNEWAQYRKDLEAYERQQKLLVEEQSNKR